MLQKTQTVVKKVTHVFKTAAEQVVMELECRFEAREGKPL